MFKLKKRGNSKILQLDLWTVLHYNKTNTTVGTQKGERHGSRNNKSK